MIRILQLTDTHILGKKPSIFLGIDSLENLKNVISEIIKDINLIKPDLLVLTGDLSHDQSPESYKYIAEQLANLSVPAAIVPGNHDDPDILAQILNNQQRDFLYDNWHIILLNSYYAGHDSGTLNIGELDFLQKALKKHPQKHTLIFLHHHVVKTGCLWLDTMGVQNAEDLLAILYKYKNIKIVASGHGHQDNISEYNGIKFIISPAASVQFKKYSSVFTLDTLMPGYRWFNLYADGNYETGVARVKEDKNLIPDLEITGY